MTTLQSSMPMTVIPGATMLEFAEGARRATDENSSIGPRPDPEVAAIAKRRHFSSAEKRRILADADRCSKSGEIGALMRREGIYSSHLATWRRQREQADHAALAPRKRGPKPDPQARHIERLNKSILRLNRKLERAELIIEAQKKLCVALGLPTADDRSKDE